MARAGAKLREHPTTVPATRSRFMLTWRPHHSLVNSPARVTAHAPIERLCDTETVTASAAGDVTTLFYPRGCAAPLRGITPIATLERFYCEQKMSAAPPGAAHRAQGIAQAVTALQPKSAVAIETCLRAERLFDIIINELVQRHSVARCQMINDLISRPKA